MASLSRTLADLHAEGIAHRDLKPSNLFQCNGQWVLGDFGLVEFPGKSEITTDGERLGPSYFIAPEMLTKAHVSDGRKADVWCFAKTIWVLATGQTFPPPGEHPISVDDRSIRVYISHSRTHYLDRLIDRMTKTNPDERPSMVEVANELTAWEQRPSPAIPNEDISEIAARIAALVAPSQRSVEVRLSYVELGERLLQELVKRLGRFAKELLTTGCSDGNVNVGDDAGRPFLTQDVLGTPARIWQRACWIEASSPEEPDDRSRLHRVSLWTGAELILRSNGELHFQGGHCILSSYFPQSVWSLNQTVSIGSAQQDVLIDAFFDGLSVNLRNAVERFLAWLEWMKDDRGRNRNPPGMTPRNPPVA